MTDEEMAEEYLDEKCKDCYMCSYSEHKNPYKICQRRKDRKQAFLAGLKTKEKENAELKEKLKPENCLKLLAKEGYIKFTSDQLTKAKEILQVVLDKWKKERWILYSDEEIKQIENLMEQAEQFLKEIEK